MFVVFSLLKFVTGLYKYFLKDQWLTKTCINICFQNGSLAFLTLMEVLSRVLGVQTKAEQWAEFGYIF